VRVIVTGGRKYSDAGACKLVLHTFQHGTILVHGGAPGLDTLISRIWESEFHGVAEPVFANWSLYGDAAPFIRNQEMVDRGAEYGVRFPGGSGTADCVRRMLKAKIPVYDHLGNRVFRDPPNQLSLVDDE
jgi:YspA, cpYpsA-related SLOG family